MSKAGLSWKNEIGKSFESRMTSSFDEEDEGPEIIDLQPTLAQQNNKHVSWRPTYFFVCEREVRERGRKKARKGV